MAVLVILDASLLGQAGENRLAPIVAALRDDQFDKALNLLGPALKQSPGNAELWTMQGAAYQGKGDTQQALLSFRHALKLAPDNIPALEKAAQIEYDAADPEGIPILERLIRLRPNDVTSHGMLAVLEYQKGDCAAAADHFDKAAALFESKLPALHAYGTCLVKLKRFEKADEVFQKSLALDPGDRHERQIAASVALMAYQAQEAITTLEPLLGASPDPLTLELASAAYEDLHQTDKAVEMLRQAILLDPHKVNLYVDFAALAATHQSVSVGINVVNDGINLQPKAAPLYFARGVLYVQLADYGKAQDDFEKAYDLDPSQSLSVAAQGLAAMQSDLAHALAGVREKLAHRPGDPILLYIEADILAQQGADPGSEEFQTAMRSARRAVELRPALAPAHGVLGKLYLQAGRNSEAAAECRKALQLDPKDQSALYTMIQALHKDDRNHEIPQLLKQLAALRQQDARDKREQNRYTLVEGDAPSK